MTNAIIKFNAGDLVETKSGVRLFIVEHNVENHSVKVALSVNDDAERNYRNKTFTNYSDFTTDFLKESEVRLVCRFSEWLINYENQSTHTMQFNPDDPENQPSFVATQLLGTYGEKGCSVVNFNGMMAVCPEELTQGPILISKDQVDEFYGLVKLKGYSLVSGDNFNRDYYQDVLIATGIESKEVADLLVERLNQAYSGIHASRYYKVVDSSHIPEEDLEGNYHKSWHGYQFDKK